MAYDVHITRREEWSVEGENITLAEWLAIANAGVDLTVSSDGSAEMRGPDGQAWPLWWQEGRVETKKPNKEFIIKMVALARPLNAKVQGDDSEIYHADGTRGRCPPSPCGTTRTEKELARPGISKLLERI
jgi:hypothetical protein